MTSKQFPAHSSFPGCAYHEDSHRYRVDLGIQHTRNATDAALAAVEGRLHHRSVRIESTIGFTARMLASAPSPDQLAAVDGLDDEERERLLTGFLQHDMLYQAVRLAGSQAGSETYSVMPVETARVVMTGAVRALSQLSQLLACLWSHSISSNAGANIIDVFVDVQRTLLVLATSQASRIGLYQFPVVPRVIRDYLRHLVAEFPRPVAGGGGGGWGWVSKNVFLDLFSTGKNPKIKVKTNSHFKCCKDAN
jgi:hypothetical protein